MTEPWRYVFTTRAERELERTPLDVQRRVFAALDRLARDPRDAGMRKLEGTRDEWRIRVGDWRVRFMFDVAEHRIVILHVLPRGRAYRD